MRIAIGTICAPTPCPEWYNKKDIIDIIRNDPKCLKKKYRDKHEEIVDDMLCEFNIHKWDELDQKYFKSTYWKYMLEKENGELTEEQWDGIKDSYDKTSSGLYTPATPTRFNYGTFCIKKIRYSEKQAK